MTALGTSLASLAAGTSPALSFPRVWRPLRVAGVDPGTRHVGLCVCEVVDSRAGAAGLNPIYAADVTPDEALERVRRYTSPRPPRGVDAVIGNPAERERFVEVVVAERVALYLPRKRKGFGAAPPPMAISSDVRDTIELFGQFREAATSRGATFYQAERSKIRAVVVGLSGADDDDARTGVVNLLGGEAVMKGEKCRECKGRGFVGGKVRGRPCEACRRDGESTGWKTEPSALGRLRLLADAHAWQALAAVAWWAETTGAIRGAP